MGGAHGDGITYKGVTLHKPKRWHTVTGKGLCAVMWFYFCNNKGFGFSTELSRTVLWCWGGGILGMAMMIIISYILAQCSNMGA
ncbi:hypothetical protein CASFOL_012451 [Castilleja foliolosa]|uniref:Uncharacterized protein n=1 Tax=Castilleja foliolosa TaxID=1961234 RepID=A0ABD3DL57_9LAMI